MDLSGHRLGQAPENLDCNRIKLQLGRSKIAHRPVIPGMAQAETVKTTGHGSCQAGPTHTYSHLTKKSSCPHMAEDWSCTKFARQLHQGSSQALECHRGCHLKIVIVMIMRPVAFTCQNDRCYLVTTKPHCIGHERPSKREFQVKD